MKCDNALRSSIRWFGGRGGRYGNRLYCKPKHESKKEYKF